MIKFWFRFFWARLFPRGPVKYNCPRINYFRQIPFISVSCWSLVQNRNDNFYRLGCYTFFTKGRENGTFRSTFNSRQPKWLGTMYCTREIQRYAVSTIFKGRSPGKGACPFLIKKTLLAICVCSGRPVPRRARGYSEFCLLHRLLEGLELLNFTILGGKSCYFGGYWAFADCLFGG